jgi:hypothetical protein
MEWLTNSGMKVNIAKTEFTVFHKSLNTARRVSVGMEWIGAKQEMSILGIVFESHLERTKQVDKSIFRARQSSQALRRIRRQFYQHREKQFGHVLVFSRMYYGSKIWLLPNLKE